MGEYFRDTEEDALIVYDDLSKQGSCIQRNISVIEKTPWKRGFPGDVFLSSLKVATEGCSGKMLSDVEKVTDGKVKGQTGSLTPLPIVGNTGRRCIQHSNQQHVISITDGQIF